MLVTAVTAAAAADLPQFAATGGFACSKGAATATTVAAAVAACCANSASLYLLHFAAFNQL